MFTRTAEYCMLLAAVLLMASCTHREPKENSGRRSAKTMFSAGLDPEVEQAVQGLKEGTRVPIDEETRRKIAHLVEELSGQHEPVGAGVGTMASKAAAARQLEAIGAPVIPYLIEAAATEQAPIARQYALAILQRLAQKDDRLPEFVPVFVRSLSDRDPNVRGAAIAQIGITAEELRSEGQVDKLDAAIPCLVESLRDEEETVRRQAASCLMQMNRKDLVPQEWIETGTVGESR